MTETALLLHRPAEFAEKVLKEPQLGAAATEYTGILMVYPTCCIHVLEVNSAPIHRGSERLPGVPACLSMDQPP